MSEQMSEEEMRLRDDRIAWGVYCEKVKDVSFASWQQIKETAKIDQIAEALTTTDTSAQAVAKLDAAEEPTEVAPPKGRRK